MRPQNKNPRVVFRLWVQIYNKNSVIFKGLRLPKRYLKDRSKIKLSFLIFFNLFDSDKLQIQVVNERPDLLVDLRREVLRDGGEGGIGTGIGCAVPADEPVGNVDVGLVVFRLTVFDQQVRHGVGEALQLSEFLVPGLVAINVGKCGDGAALQDGEALVNLGLSAGGQPDELRDEAGADDGRLFGFNQGNRLLGEEGQQVLTEEALRQRPFLRKLAGVFHQGMHPGDAAFGVLVLDAVAGLGVVFHHFARPASALDVYLVEDDGFLTRDPDTVFLDEGGNRYRVKKGAKKSDEVGVEGGADAPGNNVVRDGVHFVHSVYGWTGWTLVDRFVQPLRGLPPVFGIGSGFRMVPEVLSWSVVIVAAGFVVAPANGFVKGLAVVIDVKGEAALPATVWAGVTGGGAGVFLKMIVKFHCCRVLL